MISGATSLRLEATSDTIPPLMKSAPATIARGLELIALAVLAALLFAGPLAGGATRADHSFAMVALALLSAGLLAAARAIRPIDDDETRRHELRQGARLAPFVWIAAGFIALVVLQQVELPDWIVRSLDSHAASEHTSARSSVEGLADWEDAEPRIHGATVSLTPERTFHALAICLGGIAVFFTIAVGVRTRGQLVFLVVVLLAAGVVQAGLALREVLSGASEVNGSYPNRNYFAGLLEMVAPLAVALTMDRRIEMRKDMTARERFFAAVSETARVGWKVGLFALFIVLGGVIFLSRSRMGVIGFGIGVLALAAASAREHGGRWQRRALLAGLSGVVILVLASVILRDHPTVARFSLLVSGEDVGAATRVEVWRDAITIFGDHPMLGTGLGSFGAVHSVYQSPEYLAPHFEYAHNDWLNLLSDTGIVGFSLAFLAIGLWVYRVLRRRDELRTYQKGLISGVFAGVLAMLAHSLVDFNMQVPANAYVFAALLGLGLATSSIHELKFVRLKRRNE